MGTDTGTEPDKDLGPTTGHDSDDRSREVLEPAMLGMNLGRYRLDGVLGQGAMATVFRGTDTVLDRHVAIKVMNLAIAARSESAARFEREAKAVAGFKHTNVVHVHDFVPSENGAPAFLVMELIEGDTLGAWMDRAARPMMPEVACLVAAQVADALAVAHDAGVVHRDVKPENVLVERKNGVARAALTDFGVARLANQATMTATGALVGSPAFMSPEQASGSAVTAATDIWALGVLVYFLTTGAMPFAGDAPLLVLSSVLHGKFRRPSQVAPSIGPELQAIILKCMARSPGARYDSARSLSDALRAYARPAVEFSGLSESAFVYQAATDPEVLEEKVAGPVADAAVRAATSLQRSAPARALAELGRALAYQPAHPDALALQKKFARHPRKLGKRGIAALAGIGLTAAVGLWLTTPDPKIDVPKTKTAANNVVFRSLRHVPQPKPSTTSRTAKESTSNRVTPRPAGKRPDELPNELPLPKLPKPLPKKQHRTLRTLRQMPRRPAPPKRAKRNAPRPCLRHPRRLSPSRSSKAQKLPCDFLPRSGGVFPA